VWFTLKIHFVGFSFITMIMMFMPISYKERCITKQHRRNSVATSIVSSGKKKRTMGSKARFEGTPSDTTNSYQAPAARDCAAKVLHRH
jgi:hypothetical protein